MNIVKLKDKIKPGDDFFNTHLKGKYAWWIHMRFIVPFEYMGINGYIACEEDLRDLYRMPYGAEYRDTYDKEMWEYVDEEATDAANVINVFKLHNQYVSDKDITIDQIKQFRTWLAQELLNMDANNKGIPMYDLFTTTQTYVLQYYANNMYDDVIKRLSEISKNTITLTSSSCGCNSINNISTISSCDPITIYRKDTYEKMVEMFSEIDFWARYSTEFLSIFKKYIDNIINNKLPLQSNSHVNVYNCNCSNSNDRQYIDMLNRLSVSLDYMIQNQISGHKNYIHDALRDWAVYLYENMYW